MKLILIIVGVLLFATFIFGLIGYGIKKQEKAIKEQFKDAQDKIKRGKKATKVSKKSYGKNPKEIF